MNYSKIWAAFKISLAISLIFPACVLAHNTQSGRQSHLAGNFLGEAAAGHYPTWGNVCRYEEPTNCMADCVFASVANWEILKLHYKPGEAAVESAFLKAGGSPVEGIYPDKAGRWLHRVGIEGVRLTFHTIYYPELAQMKRWIRHYKILLAGTSDHEVTIDGATERGVRYVTYGEQREIPWAEANLEFEELTEVSVYA